MQRTGAHAEELGGELVAAVGADDPHRAVVVPLEVLHLGVEQRVVVEAVLLPDALAVLEDLRRVRVLLGGHVPGLLEQRHVHEARGVALGAGVAVPVPGAAEVAALLDDADVVDAGFLEPGAGDEPGEAAADEREGDVVGLRARARPAACTGRRGSGRAGPSAGGTARCRRAAAAWRAPPRTSALSASLSILRGPRHVAESTQELTRGSSERGHADDGSLPLPVCRVTTPTGAQPWPDIDIRPAAAQMARVLEGVPDDAPRRTDAMRRHDARPADRPRRRVRARCSRSRPARTSAR